jgi:hypothetical protein
MQLSDDRGNRFYVKQRNADDVEPANSGCGTR